MNIECQEILITLTNPRWKAQMYLDLWNALSPKQSEHERTVRTLQDLIVSDPTRADLYRGCLEKLESGYDL